MWQRKRSKTGRGVVGQIRARSDEGMDSMAQVKDFTFYHLKNNDKLVKVLKQGQG